MNTPQWTGPGGEKFTAKREYVAPSQQAPAQLPSLDWYDDYGATVTSECGVHGVIELDGPQHDSCTAHFLDETARFIEWTYEGPTLYDAFTWIMHRYAWRDF